MHELSSSNRKVSLPFGVCRALTDGYGAGYWSSANANVPCQDIVLVGRAMLVLLCNETSLVQS